MNKLRRDLLKLIGIGQFADEAVFQDPCLSFIVPEVCVLPLKSLFKTSSNFQVKRMKIRIKERRFELKRLELENKLHFYFFFFLMFRLFASIVTAVVILTFAVILSSLQPKEINRKSKLHHIIQ